MTPFHPFASLMTFAARNCADAKDAMPTLSAFAPLATYRSAMYFTLAVTFYVVSWSPAYAAVTPMGAVLMDILCWMYGSLGRGVATIGVISVGVAAALGKASWGLALTVGVGISIIFNCVAIAGTLLHRDIALDCN
jgi:type IV secretory pathway VirB2 component (pilin)